MPLVTPTIYFKLFTNAVGYDVLMRYVKAQQVQLDRDFKKFWGSSARCIALTPAIPVPKDGWLCGWFDHSDQADALGYHDVTAQGTPILKVFAKDSLEGGMSPSATSSHEVIEALGDPWIDNTVTVTGKDGITWEYARELADAPEDDRFATTINGCQMSNFVTPAWFDPDARHGPWTAYPCDEITAPFMLASGGYIGRRVVRPTPGEWMQLIADENPNGRSKKGPSSRTLRRFEGRLPALDETKVPR